MSSDYQTAAYWFDMAEYDLDTAKAMLTTKRLLYVGFMCHQVIEKSLKGVFVSQNPENSIPYIHNLTKLAKLSGLYEIMDNMQKDTLDFLDP